jgi:hypothetical protein
VREGTFQGNTLCIARLASSIEYAKYLILGEYSSNYFRTTLMKLRRSLEEMDPVDPESDVSLRLEEEESYLRLPALGFLFGNLNPETGELDDESILGPDSAEQIRGLGLMGLELDGDWGIAADAESDSKDLDADTEEELPIPIPVSPITTQEDSLAVAAKLVFVDLAPMKRKSTDSVVPEAKSIKLDEEYDYESDDAGTGNYDSNSNRQEGSEAILAYGDGDNDDEAGPSSASLILSEAVENMSDLMAINSGHI